MQSLLPQVGWFLVGVGADLILAKACPFVPFRIIVVYKLGFVVVVVVVVAPLIDFHT